jgi:hypothetical protein
MTKQEAIQQIEAGNYRVVTLTSARIPKTEKVKFGGRRVITKKTRIGKQG